MKKISKRIIASALAGCLSLGSTIGAFAVSRTPSPIEDGDQRRIIASFVHGSEYVNSGGTDGAGYNFAMSGLPNGGSVKAGNFIKLYALDPSVNVTNNTVGATIEGDSLYCLCPNQPVNVNYGTGYLATAHTESKLDGDLPSYQGRVRKHGQVHRPLHFEVGGRLQSRRAEIHVCRRRRQCLHRNAESGSFTIVFNDNKCVPSLDLWQAKKVNNSV